MMWTMKLWERVVEARLRTEEGTTDVILALRMLMEKH